MPANPPQNGPLGGSIGLHTASSPTTSQIEFAGHSTTAHGLTVGSQLARPSTTTHSVPAAQRTAAHGSSSGSFGIQFGAPSITSQVVLTGHETAAQELTPVLVHVA
jgi:hypothetical protein